MKIYVLAGLIVLAAGLNGCISGPGWQTVHGSGNVLTETRQVSDFHRASVSGSGELTIEQGDQPSLTITADDNLLPLIRSDVDKGRLSIGPWRVNVRPTETIRYHLVVNDLTELDLSGAVRAAAKTLSVERLDLRISGSGKIEIAHLEAETLSTHISGSGRIAAAGRADRQDIHISGSGDHYAPELKSSDAEAHISGSGRASLWVANSLDTHISGSGRIDYRGDAHVQSHVSGSGRVQRVAGVD